jgi:hypothetical protein
MSAHSISREQSETGNELAELDENMFDRVQVRRIGRQESEASTTRSIAARTPATL